MNITSLISVASFNPNFFSKKENEEEKMDELVHLILDFLPVDDLKAMRLTCKRFQKMTETKLLDFMELKLLRQDYQNTRKGIELTEEALNIFKKLVIKKNGSKDPTKRIKNFLKTQIEDLKNNNNNNKESYISNIEQMIKNLTSQNETRLSSIKSKEFSIEKKKFNRKIMDLFGGKEEFEKLPLLELENGKTFCMSAPIMRVKFKNVQTKEPHFILRIDYKDEEWRGWTSLFRVDDFGLLAFLPIFEGKDLDLWGITAPPTYVVPLKSNGSVNYYDELRSLIAHKENKRVIIR